MSIQRRSDEKKLSKGVLDLKFMKKSKEKREILDDAEERQQLYQGQLSMLHEGADRIIMLSSYYDCKKFLPCRLSFGGMDPDIEKLNADKLTGLYKVIKQDVLPSEASFTGMDADVDEEEMAESLLAGNIRKKFGIKRKSGPEEFGDDEEGNNNGNDDGGDVKKFRPSQVSGRQLFTRDIENDRGGFRGRGDFRGRGQGDFRGRGRGDFRGRGDSRGRSRGRGGGRGDFRDRGRGDFRGRGRGDFRDRGRGDFRGRGRGDSRGRGRGDSRGRGRGRGDFNDRGDFHGRSKSYDAPRNSFNQDNDSHETEHYDNHSHKKMKFMKPDSD